MNVVHTTATTGLWTAGCVALAILLVFVVPAYAADLTMTLTFSATGPTEVVAGNELMVVLAGVADSHEYLRPAVGGMSVDGRDGMWRAVGNVTLTGSPEDLLAVEERYALADVRVSGEGMVWLVAAGSVLDLGGKHVTALFGAVFTTAGVCGVAAWRYVWRGPELVCIFLWVLFGVGAVSLWLSYLNYLPYALH